MRKVSEKKLSEGKHQREALVRAFLLKHINGKNLAKLVWLDVIQHFSTKYSLFLFLYS